MVQPRSYRISAVAQATGVSIDTIRMWERRYRLIEPVRDSAGVRRYSDADVERLRLARRATTLGHAIGEVARLSDEDIRALVAGEPRQSPTRTIETNGDAKARYVEKIVDALLSLDVARAEKQLNAAFFFLEPRDVIIDIMAPLMHRIGDEWASGELDIVHEHAASQIVRNVSANALRLAAQTGTVRLVFATPPGEHHDFGIAFAANLAVLRGAQVFMLGADLPMDELLRGVRRIGANAVIASATVTPTAGGTAHYFQQLDNDLPSDVKLFVGGPAAQALDTSQWSSRSLVVSSLRELDDNFAQIGL